MASRQREDAGRDGKLSVGAAHYYARIYAAARAGCLSDLRRAGCSEEDAQDIFAATLERIMRKFDPTEATYAPQQMVALLKKACRQKLIDERRHRGVLKMVPLEEAGSRFDGGSESPPEAVETREAVAMGREAISSLPERDQAIFFQRHKLNLTPDEILRRNPGLSRRTYRKIMQRANARALEAFEAIDSGARCVQLRGELLRSYVAGEAGEEELAIVRAHLLHCRPCRLEAAQMRTHMHDIATGLAAVIAVECAHGSLLAGWATQLLDRAWAMGEALGAATRAARERLRELALRVATALPGSGGESTAGQIAGISGAKALSACAAGAIASGCLAAGVVPGVGVLGQADQDRRPDPARPAQTRAPQPAAPAPTQTLGSTVMPAAKPSPTDRESAKAKQGKALTRSLPEARREASARPSPSADPVGTGFGSEATGAGTPIPPAPTESSDGRGMSPGGEVSASRNTSPSARPSPAAAEFGF